MLKLVVTITLSIFTFTLPGQSFFDTHQKKLTKELSKWNEEYSGLDHIRTIDHREFYQINSSKVNDSCILVLSSAHGRFDKFDLMTVMNSEKIELIKILKYRSEYGAEVTNKKWLSQFYTKPDSTYVFRKNIDAISGATFSTMGLIEELNQVIKATENMN